MNDNTITIPNRICKRGLKAQLCLTNAHCKCECPVVLGKPTITVKLTR